MDRFFGVGHSRQPVQRLWLRDATGALDNAQFQQATRFQQIGRLLLVGGGDKGAVVAAPLDQTLAFQRGDRAPGTVRLTPKWRAITSSRIFMPGRRAPSAMAMEIELQIVSTISSEVLSEGMV